MSCFIFSLAQVELVQQVMRRFTYALTGATRQPEKVALATETMQQINARLAAMRRAAASGEMYTTTFDYNEKVVIAAAIQLHMVELLGLPASPQREQELQDCRQIMCFALDGRAASSQH